MQILPNVFRAAGSISHWGKPMIKARGRPPVGTNNREFHSSKIAGSLHREGSHFWFQGEFGYGIDHEIQHLSRQSRIDPDPEHAVHTEVSVVQIADSPKVVSLIRRLPQKVPTEQQAGGDFLRLKRADQLLSRKGS